MESDQLSQIEKAQKAEVLVDKILPFLPDYGVFHFAYYAKEVLLWKHEDVIGYALFEHHISHLALNQFKYVSEKTKGFYFELTDIGRDAKSKGGHFKFLEYLKEKKAAETDRQNRKDQSDKLDLQIKGWQVKSKYLPYIFSTLALIGTCISILISIKALNRKIDAVESLKPSQQKNVKIRSDVKVLDSLDIPKSSLKVRK